MSEAHSFITQTDTQTGAVMEFTAGKKTFLRCLAHVQSVVEKRGTIPILANVKVEALPGEVRLTATDMDIALTESFEASVEIEGSLTVPAHTLYEIIRKMPDDTPISCSTERNGAGLSITGNKCAFSLPVLPSEEFPMISAGETRSSFTLPPAELIQLIEKTQFAMSTEQTRFYLNGVYFHYEERDEGGVLITVATDGHRLAKAEIPAPEGCAYMPAIIVPRKTITEIRKIVEEYTDPITINLSEDKITFIFADGTLISKLIDGNFPEYRQALPQSEQSTMQVYKEALSKAIERVSIVAADKTRAVSMHVSRGSMILRAKSDTNSVAEETLEVSYDGEDIEMVFNHRFISEVLSTIDGDTVLFHLSDPREAVLLSDPVCEGVLYVIMPMRM